MHAVLGGSREYSLKDKMIHESAAIYHIPLMSHPVYHRTTE